MHYNHTHSNITNFNRQIQFLVDLPENLTYASYIAIFVHNKDQMYFPKSDEIYGSNFKSIKINEELLKNNVSQFLMDYDVKRTHMKALDTPEKKCDTSNSAGNVTQCITNYLENTIGCSMNFALSDSKLKR